MEFSHESAICLVRRLLLGLSRGIARCADEPATAARSRRSGSSRTPTGKGPSSRPARNTWRWACPTSSRRCGSCESSPASASRSTRWPTCGRSWSAIPAEEADFRRFLAEGRLQLAGALDVMPDVNMPGGETFVRQMQYGKGYYRDKLGVDVTTGWLLDTFGHHAQMPQLLRSGGLQVVLVLPRRASAGPPLRVLLGRDRRHADPRVLAAA